MSLDPDCTDFHTVNNLSSAVSSNGFSAGRPIIAPLWDDLSADFSTGNVNYKLTGTAGSRVLTVEWNKMIWHWSGAAGTISFQAKLYEGSNIIEFIYRQDAGALAGTPSASIGLGGLNTGDYYSLNGTGQLQQLPKGRIRPICPRAPLQDKFTAGHLPVRFL